MCVAVKPLNGNRGTDGLFAGVHAMKESYFLSELRGYNPAS